MTSLNLYSKWDNFGDSSSDEEEVVHEKKQPPVDAKTGNSKLEVVDDAGFDSDDECHVPVINQADQIAEKNANEQQKLKCNDEIDMFVGGNETVSDETALIKAFAVKHRAAIDKLATLRDIDETAEFLLANEELIDWRTANCLQKMAYDQYMYYGQILDPLRSMIYNIFWQIVVNDMIVGIMKRNGRSKNQCIRIYRRIVKRKPDANKATVDQMYERFKAEMNEPKMKALFEHLRKENGVATAESMCGKKK